MTDNFLSNDNYYNRGGLKSKPKEPRPTLIKGQSDKIKDLQGQLKRKEQECDKYKQALDEIRQYRVCEINDVDGEEDDVILGIIDEVMEP